MIDLDNMAEAFQDIMGVASESGEGYTLSEMKLRFEMAGIEFEDFRTFVTSRLINLAEVTQVDEAWAKGYTHAAMEFILYGVLMGKEEVINMEI